MNETPKDITSPRVEPPKRQNGLAIRVIREKDGWSQNQLAKMVGIAQPSLSEIEGETVNAKVVTLNRIARQLHIPVGAIMRGPHPDAEAGAEPEAEPAGAAALCPSPEPSASSAAPASPAGTPTPSSTQPGSSRSAVPGTRGPR
jgi:DNA-binding XRE family transcriptional regulator